MRFRRKIVKLYGKTPKGNQTCINYGNTWVLIQRETFNKTGNPTGKILIEPDLDIPNKNRESKRIWIEEHNDPDYQVIIG